MIIVGIDGSRMQCSGRHADVVRPLFHFGTELAQFGRHRCDAVGFLDSPAGDVAQGGLALGEQGGRGQRHRGIGNMVAIEIDGDQPPLRRLCLHPVRAHLDARPHFCQSLGKFHITLDRIPAYAFDTYRATANGAQREKIGSGGGITLNIDRPRRDISATRLDGKALPAVALDNDTEASHGRQRNLDIGLGNQLANHLDNHRLTGQRQSHQQASQELTGDIAAHLDHAARLDVGRPKL